MGQTTRNTRKSGRTETSLAREENDHIRRVLYLHFPRSFFWGLKSISKTTAVQPNFTVFPSSIKLVYLTLNIKCSISAI